MPRDVLSSARPGPRRDTARQRSRRAPRPVRAEGLEPRTLLSFVGPMPEPAPVARLEWHGTTAEAMAGEWIVSFEPPAPATGVGPASADGVQQLLAARRDDVRVIETLDSRGTSLVAAPPAVGYEQLAASFASLPGFRYLQPNFRYTIDAVPNDPRFGELWSLRNTGQTGGTAGADIGAVEAWDQSTGDGVIVAVIDTGVNYYHPDLAASMWRNPGEVPANGSDDDGNGFVDDVFGWDYTFSDRGNGTADPMDEHGHGTHVAGTVAAVANNGLGVAGVAFGARVMALRFLDEEGSGATSDAVKCVNYVTMMRQRGVNVRVMNASWGGGAYDPAMADALEAAGRAGILFVGSAGNGGEDRIGDDNDAIPHFPSGYELANVVAVAATNAIDERTGFSNFGRRSVDLGAPGDAILSTVPGTGVLSDPSGYRAARGTSMAAPHVSGAAALAFALAPGASAAVVKDILLGSSVPVPTLAGVTVSGGRLSAAGALRDLALSVAYSSPSAGEHLSGPPDRYVLGFARRVDPTTLAASDLTVNGVPADGVTLSPSGLDATFTFDQSPVAAQGPYRMRLQAGAVLRDDDGVPLRGYDAVFYHDLDQGRLLSMEPLDRGILPVGPDGRTPEITLRFSEPIDAASVGVDDLVLSAGVAGGRVVSARATGPDSAAYALGDFRYDASALLYTLTGSVTDVHGNPLRAAARRFYIVDVGHTLLTGTFNYPVWHADAVGLAHEAKAHKLLRVPGQVRRFTFGADAGHTAAVVITPTGGLAPRVTLTGPSGQAIGSAAAAGPGRRATVWVPSLPEGGAYQFVVDSPNGATGPFTAEVILNAGLDREWYGDRASNDERQGAQDLNGLFRRLPGDGGEWATLVARGDPDTYWPVQEADPNDAIATANRAATSFGRASGGAAPPRFFHTMISADVAGPADADWFTIGALSAGDVLSAAASGAASNRGTAPDLRLRLFRHNGGQPLLVALDDDTGSGADPLLHRARVEVADTYYVVADTPSGSGAGTYQLSLLLEPTAATAPGVGLRPAAEAEPNDSAAAATDLSRAWRLTAHRSTANGSIYTQSPFSLTQGAGDLDYYEYRFNAGDLLTVRVTTRPMQPAPPTPPPRKFRVAIVDGQNRVLARDDGSILPADPGTAPLYGFRVPASGNYYVVVATDANVTSSEYYAVDVFLSADQPPPAPPNQYTGNRDYYRFSLAWGQRLSVVADVNTLELEDAGGREVASYNSNSQQVQGKSLRYTAPATGTYYLRTTHYLHGDYSHGVVVLRDADSEVEHVNDQRGAAQDITGLRSVIGGTDWPPFDADWFRITLAPGQRLRLRTYTPGDGPSGLNRLDPALALYYGDAQVAFDDNGASDGRNASLTYLATAGGTYYLNAAPANATAASHRGQYVVDIDVDRVSWVAGRHVFYNDSLYDGDDPAADSRDDAAIATDKTPLLPGATPTFSNVTGYGRGITGVMIDVGGMAAAVAPTADDFVFRVGAAATWRNAPPPAAMAIRRGAGTGGSDRITFTWNDGEVRNTWLQVTVKATERTGLTTPDVFSFGHLAGDTGGRAAPGTAASVDALDLLRTRRATWPEASITDPHDHNRDGYVSPADYAIARSNLNRRLPANTAPAPPAAAPVLSRAGSSDEEADDAGSALL